MEILCEMRKFPEEVTMQESNFWDKAKNFVRMKIQHDLLGKMLESLVKKKENLKSGIFKSFQFLTSFRKIPQTRIKMEIQNQHFL